MDRNILRAIDCSRLFGQFSKCWLCLGVSEKCSKVENQFIHLGKKLTYFHSCGQNTAPNLNPVVFFVFIKIIHKQDARICIEDKFFRHWIMLTTARLMEDCSLTWGKRCWRHFLNDPLKNVPMTFRTHIVQKRLTYNSLRKCTTVPEEIFKKKV